MANSRAAPCYEGAIRSVRADAACLAGKRVWILVATILGSTIAYIDESVVDVALPAMQSDLRASVTVIQWVVNAYMLFLSALLLIGGAAGDRFGRRRIFVIGAAIFAAASIWCGLSQGTTQLIIARAAQGIGAALLIPCSLAIIGASFDETERGKAIGTWAGFSAVAGALGPLLGGWIVDHLTWRWIFLINPLLALPAIWIALRQVPESYGEEARHGLDWPGALLALAGLGGLSFGLIASSDFGWRSPAVIGSLLIGILVLAAFVWTERRSRAPMMPLGLFRSRTFTAANLLTLLLYAALGGAFFFLPFALIQVHGYSATLTGAAFLPFTLLMGALSRWAGGLQDRIGVRLPVIIGPVIAAIGFGLLGLSEMEGSYWTTFFLPLVALGIGMALNVAPLTTAVINAVPEDETGVASGINNAVASVGSLLAVAVLGAVALHVFHRGLDTHLATRPVSSEIRQAVEAARGKFVIEPTLESLRGNDRQVAASILKNSLADGIRAAMLMAAGLAVAGAVCAAFTLRGRGDDHHHAHDGDDADHGHDDGGADAHRHAARAARADPR
jgi:EmrB/QacA subfamily drug resistance transporter